MINLSSENLKTAEFMNKTDSTMRIFSFMESTQNENFKFLAFRAMVHLAESNFGKKVKDFISTYTLQKNSKKQKIL